MNKSLKKHDGRLSRYLSSSIFFVVAFLFWMLVLPYHIRYQEEIQFFPYTWQHFARIFEFPGGFASYIGEFLVQFFRVGWLGALITAALLLLCQLQTSSLIKSFREDAGDILYAFSFIPAICVWAFLCDPGNLYSAPVALLSVNAGWLAFRKSFYETSCGPVIAAIVSAVAYFLSGPMAFLLVFYSFVGMLSSKSGRNGLWILVASLAGMAVSVSVSVPVFVQYPVKSLLYGVEYSHITGQYTLTYWLLYVSSMAVMLPTLLPGHGNHSRSFQIVMTSLTYALVTVSGFLFVKQHTSRELESMYAYDTCAADRRWDKIIEMAERKTPSTPAEVTCLNTALIVTNRSGERLFDFFQAGIAGLFPNYDTYSFLKMTGAEALYQAGLLNMALHYSFEAYQTFPGFRGSGRQMKRMAEINLLRGDTAVAEKYLKILSRTLFYGRWARKYLNHPESLGDDPEYARLLGCRNSEPDIYDDMDEFPKQLVLRSQLRKSGSADISYHFLLAYDMLSRDVEAFVEDVKLAHPDGPVPVLYQEAMALPWIMTGGRGEPDAAYVSQQIKDYGQELMDDLRSGKTLGYLRKRYGRTLWYYFMDFKK